MGPTKGHIMTVTGSHTYSTSADADLNESVAGLARAARDAGRAGARIQVSIGGRSTDVPPEIAEALAETLTLLTHHGGVVIGAVDKDVTTGQAAKMLGVSRTYVCRLVDDGRLPCRYVGTHRRIKTADVLAFAERRLSERRAALDDLARVSAEAGLYDDDI